MTTFTAADIPRVRDACLQALHDYNLPGLAIAVVEGEHLLYGEGFGLADIKGRREMSISHRQRIGSITKTMTALCIMANVDAGQLRLDSPISELLPDLTFTGAGNAGDLTIQHLLTHPGGIGEAPTREHLHDPETALWTDSPELLDAPQRYPDGIEIEVDPGSKWSYANHGFGLLGDILTQIEEKPLADIFRDRIFRPLEMRDSDIRDKPHYNLTPGYHRPLTPEDRQNRGNSHLWALDTPPEDDQHIRGGHIFLPIPAAGAVQSSARDMARYMGALLQRGADIVDPATFDEMVKPHWRPHPRLMGVGLSFMLETRAGHESIGHGGNIAGGWNTELAVFPQHNLGCILNFNLDDPNTTPVRAQIMHAVLDSSPEPVPSIPLDSAIVDTAPGLYESIPGDLTNVRVRWGTGRIQIEQHGDELILRSRRGAYAPGLHSNGVPIRPVDASDLNLFRLMDDSPEPAHIAFVRDTSGRVEGLLMDRAVRMDRADGT